MTAPITTILKKLDEQDAVAAVAAAIDPPLANLLQDFIALQQRQRKETDDALAEIVAKINRINSAIK